MKLVVISIVVSTVVISIVVISIAIDEYPRMRLKYHKKKDVLLITRTAGCTVYRFEYDSVGAISDLLVVCGSHVAMKRND